MRVERSKAFGMTVIDYFTLFSMPIAGAIIGVVVYFYTGPKARRRPHSPRE